MIFIFCHKYRKKKLESARLKYANYNPSLEREILLTDNTVYHGLFITTKKGVLLTSLFLYGKLDHNFIFDLTSIGNISVEKGILNVEGQNLGLITKDARVSVALKDFFYKLSIHDPSVDASAINVLLNPYVTNEFLKLLFENGVKVDALYELRDNPLTDEHITHNIGSLIFTNFRLIDKKSSRIISYQDIKKVFILPYYGHQHTPENWSVLAKIAAAGVKYLSDRQADKYMVLIETAGKETFEVDDISKGNAYTLESLLKKHSANVEAKYRGQL